ncbi:transporter substrate-binding domain-containing protein [Streptococcus castoreus]|uniref:transporter substrate-binding domain-containing protein n=1 Tax=Streptococcus castoreus TaxID=254786 RepID=UPI00042411CB|nr:transporter substrate-binding domain-containing protein [Streptococcus castoreus]
MNTKKLLLSLLTVTLLLVLASCTHAKTINQQDSIKKAGKLVVAVSPDYAPFEFKALINGKDTIVGADVQLAQAIADELGVKLELSPMSFDNVLSSLQTGKADMAISGLSYTKERAKVYDFSTPYYETENAILMKAADAKSAKDITSLNGKKVATQKGSIEEGLVKAQLPKANLISLTAMGEAINELKSGQVYAVDLEAPVAAGFLAQNKDLALAPFHLKTGEGDAKAVALPKGSGALTKTVNKVISRLVKEGKYKEFIKEAASLTGNAVD